MDTTTPAAFATVARCSVVKFGSGFDFILNIGMPLGVSKLAQFTDLDLNRLAVIFTLCLLATPTLADVTGPARVIDGDTIEIQG
jgi:hypothetical protein